jgi:hypothetical protein
LVFLLEARFEKTRQASTEECKFRCLRVRRLQQYLAFSTESITRGKEGTTKGFMKSVLIALALVFANMTVEAQNAPSVTGIQAIQHDGQTFNLRQYRPAIVA